MEFFGKNIFDGDSKPSRVKILSFNSGRPSLPFPHPWNYTISLPLQLPQNKSDHYEKKFQIHTLIKFFIIPFFFVYLP